MRRKVIKKPLEYSFVCALFNYASMDKLFIFESSEQKTFVFLEAAHLHTNGKFGKSPLVLKHARRARYAEQWRSLIIFMTLSSAFLQPF